MFGVPYKPDTGKGSAMALRRLNAQVTREWDELMARRGPDCCGHPEAIALFDMQLVRHASVMDKAWLPLTRGIGTCKLVILEDVYHAVRA